MENTSSGLNPQQIQAVTAGSGPVLVLAGPGSGKTRVLTHRIAYLIQNRVDPYHILAVTFTNKAAREMEKRVLDLAPGQAHGVMLGTFHAFCARVLRAEAKNLPVNANFAILDADDQETLVKRAIAELNLDDKRFRARAVHANISNAKNELLTPDDFPQTDFQAKTIQRVYRRYQELLILSNALDFDDLLLYTAQLLEENGDIREKYARRYEHILVDEFQDTNMAQYQLLKQLASFHMNLFVVGDADQSIYRWRGADYRNVQRFRKDYPAAPVILLEQNYRSVQNILDVAMNVIDRNPNRTRKALFTERGRGEKAVLIEAYNDQEEASYVVQTIAGLIKEGSAQPGDFAVMYRTNAQSRLVEEAFVRNNLPYKIVGAQRFYGRREVKDMVSYLRLVQNPSDEVSLLRIINVPPRKIGEKTVETLRTQAQQRGLSAGQFLLNLAKDEAETIFKGQALHSLLVFSAKWRAWREIAQTAQPWEVFNRILEDVDYREYIDDGSEEGQSRWENVLELRRLAMENRDLDLTTFLEQIALVSDQDTINVDAQVPTLLTLHAAKGLEFPIVFIVGLNDGVLPHLRSFDDPEQMMEERRLLYVGITRARDRLFLLYSQMTSMRGYSEAADPSRFLDDISPDLLQRPAKPEVIRWESPQWHGLTSRQEDKDTSGPASIEKQYSAGMHVQHPAWGIGLVLNSVIDSGDEIIDVFFENVGLKRVVASLARLQVKT
jgi:DNA helicase-2/ATP-dependent DNA helicase PcrA